MVATTGAGLVQSREPDKSGSMTTRPRILYAREQDLCAREFQTLLQDCSLGAIRPAGDPDRLDAMLRGANLIVTARRDEPERPLVGIARCVTDFSWCCYLSDLAVADAAQGLGIGRGLLEETRRIIGPTVSLMLVSVPEAVGFYRRAGMADMPDGFVFKRER
ncbi:GNAT family N-acetyltransferase [Phreatobacter sp.]|uniref:GNAT family N-acetyltransferase n=1 Tax=Phreatobacter sp. TaxID=1966341 RepID=UPI003F71421B